MKKIYTLSLLISATQTLLIAQNVGINGTGALPASSAMLDVAASNKGVLMPRVALTSTTDVATIVSPATSLMVYNTATASTGATAVTPGYYYFDGTKWISLEGTNGKNWSLLGNAGTNASTNFLGTTDNVDLVFKANNFETMRMLASNGNVGIGTQTPVRRLSIEYGDMQLGESIGANTVGRKLYFGDGNSDQLYLFRENLSNDVTDLNMFLGDNYKNGGGGDRFNVGAIDYLAPSVFGYIFTVESSGSRVGINRYSPTEALHIVGNQRLDGAFMPNNSAGTAKDILVSQGAGVAPQWQNGSALAASINSAAWTTFGNSGLPATAFMGTTDNIDIIFRRNNIRAGLIATTNTSFGTSSLLATTSGTQNVAVGALALSSTTSAGSNVAVGYQALNSSTSSNNTAVGYNTLRKTPGNNNTALGSNALENTVAGANNTAVGFQSLIANIGGTYNTAVGSGSLIANTTGTENVAIGRNALAANTTSTGNSSIGSYNMDKNTIGINNTSVGFNALQSNVAGSLAVAVGYNAMQFSNNRTTAYTNTNIGIGYQALRGSTTASVNTGLNNTAIGYETMLNNTTGSQNSALGFNTLNSNTTGIDNSALGYQALASNLTGNGNTAAGNQALFSNIAGANNTATGSGALNLNTADNNTATGYFALNKNTVGNNNTALGGKALELNVAGNSNTGVGYQALNANGFGSVTPSQGSANTAVGFNASTNNMLGTNNTSVGAYSLTNNLVSGNTAVGYYSANANTNGTGNVAIGFEALLLNTAGFDNTAVGSGALRSVVGTLSVAPFVGSGNTAVGKVALKNLTTGWENTSFGEFTGQTLTTGKENTLIGTDADVSSGTVSNSTALGNNSRATDDNSTALGDNAISPAANTVRIGNTSVTNIQGQVAYSVVSDGRFKTITNYEVKGLEFITKLRPVTYTFDTKKYDEFLVKNLSEECRRKHLSKHDYSQSSAIVHTGFIAQEVEQAAKDANFNFDGVHVPVNENDNYSVAYSQFVVPIVKSIHELNVKADAKQASTETVTFFKQQLKLQQEQINSLLQQNNELLNKLKLIENK
jgi:trimeric autotransporter adhesin